MQRVYSAIIGLVLMAALAACSESTSTPEVVGAPSASQLTPGGKESFSILVAGTPVGKLEAQHTADTTQVDFEYRNNGRGPTITESVTIGENGLPSSWKVSGASTFGTA